MKKRVFNAVATGLFGAAFLMLTGCEKNSSEPSDPGIFSNNDGVRNKIVIISDLHLGAGPYAECKENLPYLAEFLKEIKNSDGVKELVIAGDLVDEWFIPAGIEAYDGQTQIDFARRLADSNKIVFDELNEIMANTDILVTYVPGNHDLAIEEQSIESILPGINQARDEGLLGLGTYYPKGHPNIAIEHSHRYNFFCAPDMISNQDVAPGTIMPPGYFFTRIAAQSVVEGNFGKHKDTLSIDLSLVKTTEQQLMLEYWMIWAWTVGTFTLNEELDYTFIKTNQNFFTGNYAVNDLVPVQKDNGDFEVNLYKEICDEANWETRQTNNNVPVHLPLLDAIKYSNKAGQTDKMAQVEYFDNPESDVRIVVFGHNHRDTLITTQNHNGESAIYANSGTWIDQTSVQKKTANFVIITPQDDSDTSTETLVEVYNYINGKLTKEQSGSVRL